MVTWSALAPTPSNTTPSLGGVTGPEIGRGVAGVGAAVTEIRTVIDGIFTSPPVPASPTRALGILRAGLATRATVPCRVVFTGSSTTAGSNATTEAARYANRLLASLQAAYPSGTGSETGMVTSTTAAFGTPSNSPGVQGYNAGEGGTTSSTYLTAAERSSIASLNPRMVMHMVGANDYRNGVSPATYKTNMQAVLADLKSKIPGPCVHLLVNTYPRHDSATISARVAPWEDYGVVMAQLAAEDPALVAYIDISDPYTVALATTTDPFNLIDTDLVHQTNAGHAFMADLLRDRLGVAQVTSVVVLAPAITYVVQDSFTNANLLFLTSHNGEIGATWTKHPSSVGDQEVGLINGRIYQDTGATAGTMRYFPSGVPATADYVVEADVVCLSTQTSGSLGITARLTAEATRSAYSIQYSPGTGTWALLKVVSGTSSTLASITSAALAGGKTGRAKLTTKGTTISASVTIDGVATTIGSVTDADVTAKGTPGLFFGSLVSTATTGHHLDNFTVVAA